MKKTIRLTEGDLHRIVNNIINEIFDESAFWQGAHKGTLDNLNRKTWECFTQSIPKESKEIMKRD